MHTLILAGGKGTRLWPLSRELMPKQFIKLFDKSLFQMTVERASLTPIPQTYTLLNREYKFRALDDLSDLGIDIWRDHQNPHMETLHIKVESGGLFLQNSERFRNSAIIEPMESSQKEMATSSSQAAEGT
jgi:2-C-methyl-D-erythritol 4-phosphate cytidylyltransferase